MATRTKARSVPWPEFTDAILGHYREQLAACTTIESKRLLLGMLAGLGAKTSRDLDDAMVRRLLESVAPKGERYRINVMLALKSIADVGVARGILARAPELGPIPHHNILGRGRRSIPLPESDNARVLAHLRKRSGDSWEHGRICALTELIAGAGVKLRDALLLRVEDFDPAACTVTIRKARMGRAFPVVLRVDRELMASLRAWLDRAGSEWAFPIKSRTKPWDARGNDRGPLPGKPVQQLQAIAREVGVEGITFEKLRRSFAENSVRSNPNTRPKPATSPDPALPRVRLDGPDKPFYIDGKRRRILDEWEHRLIDTLLDGSAEGFGLEEMNDRCGRGGWRRTFERLEKEPVLGPLLARAGKRGGRYRIMAVRDSRS